MKIGKTNAIFGGGVVYNFVPFVAPESFTDPRKYADYGLTVNLYEKFRVYKMTWAGADIAVEFSDSIASVIFTTDQVPSDSTIEIFETVSGVETSVLRTTTGTHTFTAGSTKRYMIRRIPSIITFVLPIGSVWAYCFGITKLRGYDISAGSNAYLKYVFFYENTLTGIDRFQNSSITGIVKLHNGINKLLGNTFYNCININQLITGNNLTNIGTYDCFLCSNLKIVDLGTGIISIGDQFINGAPIERFICRAVTPPSITSATLSGLPANARIEVPSGSVSAYKAATNWKVKSSQIYAI